MNRRKIIFLSFLLIALMGKAQRMEFEVLGSLLTDYQRSPVFESSTVIGFNNNTGKEIREITPVYYEQLSTMAVGLQITKPITSSLIITSPISLGIGTTYPVTDEVGMLNGAGSLTVPLILAVRFPNQGILSQVELGAGVQGNLFPIFNLDGGLNANQLFAMPVGYLRSSVGSSEFKIGAKVGLGNLKNYGKDRNGNPIFDSNGNLRQQSGRSFTAQLYLSYPILKPKTASLSFI
jgi:hypothetical protein